MSDIVLRNTVAAQVKLRGLGETLKQRLSEQSGQDTVEYIGVLVLVAAIIAAVLAFMPNVTKALGKGATDMVNDIFNGTNPSPGGGTGTTPAG